MALTLGQFLRSDMANDKAQAKSEMDVTKLDAEAAATAAQYLPDTAKVRTSGAPTKTGAVAEAFGNDPRAEYGPEIKRVYDTLIRTPEYNGLAPGEIFAHAKEIAKYKPGEDGRSLLDRANEQQFRDESSWFGRPGKPLDPVAYQQYKAGRQAEEGNTTSFDFAHLGEQVALGAAGTLGAAGAAAAGVAAAPAILGGLAATGIYTAAKQAAQGRFLEGDHPIKDFLLDWAGNTGAVAMGVIPGAGIAKAGTSIATTAAKVGVEVAAGSEAGRLLRNAYVSSDYGKSNEGTLKGALLEMGADLGGFIAGGTAANSIIGRLGKAGAAVSKADEMTQALAVYEGGGSPAMRGPQHINFTRTYEAQQEANKTLELVGREYDANGNALVFDMLENAERAAIPGKGMLPEGNSRLPSGVGSPALDRSSSIFQGSEQTGMGAIAQPGMDVTAGRPVRVTPEGTAMTMDQFQPALPSNLPNPQEVSRMRFNPDGSVARPSDYVDVRSSENPMSPMTDAPRQPRKFATLGEMYPHAYGPQDSFQNETITALDLTPRLSSKTARKAFTQLDNPSVERALDMSAKGIPITEATSVVVKDQAIATRAAQFDNEVFTAAPVLPKSKGALRLQSLGYDADDLSRVDPAVIRMAEKLSVPDSQFVTAKKMTAALPADPMTGEAAVGAKRITPRMVGLAKEEAETKALSLRDELAGLDTAPPEFGSVYGQPLDRQMAYMQKLADDPELYQLERSKLMRMVFDRTPGLEGAADDALVDAFNAHPVSKAFNDMARRAADEGIMATWKGLDEEGQAIVSSAVRLPKYIDEGSVAIGSLAERIDKARAALADVPDSELPWKMLGLLGGSTAVLGVVGLPEDSQAGVLSSALNGMKAFMPKSMGKTLASADKKAVDEIIKSGIKEHFVGIESDPVTGAKGSYMRQVPVNKMTEASLGNEKNPGFGLASAIQRDKRLPFGLDRILSVGGLGRLVYGNNDPGVQLASMMTAVNFNINKVYGPRIQAAFDSVGAKSMAKEIGERINPIEKEAGWVTKAYSTAAHREHTISQKLEPLLAKAAEKDANPKFAERVQALQDQLAEAKQIRENLQPRYDEYVGKKNEVFKEFAGRADNPSVRMGLALDDTPDFQRYPWLKGMLSEQELQAVSLIRDVNNEYAARMLDLGQRPISRPYLHYINTPEMAQAAREGFEKFVADKSPFYANAAPYSKMYSREMFSTPIIPDAVESQFAYIHDVERRLGGMEFWGKASDKTSWLAHSKSAATQNNPAASLYWDKVKEMMRPEQYGTADRWAQRYTTFEAARLLSFAPSTGAKHLFKMFGQASQMGLTQTVRFLDDAAKIAITNMVRGAPLGKTFEGLTAADAKSPDLINTFVRSVTTQRQHANILDGFELSSRQAPGWFDKWLGGFAEKGGVFISGAEAIDRVNTVLAAADMAAKSGMTAQQAMYGIYSSIMHNNFLSGPLNAPWMKNPLIKSVAMFQVTPFKILERRLGVTLGAAASAKDAWSVLKDASGLDRVLKGGMKELKNMTPGEALTQLRGVREYITQGEAAFKTSQFAEALFKRGDTFGNSYTAQFARDALYTSLVLGGGAAAMDTDFSEHMLHIPFMKFGTGDTEIGLTTSPIVKGTIKNYKDHVEGNDFSVATFFKNYLGQQGLVPTTVHKAMRINDNDVPEIYKGSWLKYLFSAPAAGAH